MQESKSRRSAEKFYLKKKQKKKGEGWKSTNTRVSSLLMVHGYSRFALTKKKKEKDNITKTCLYNVDSLKPHFYIVKLEFTGVYIIFFLFLLKNIDCGYSLEPPRRGGSNEYQQSIFRAEI